MYVHSIQKNRKNKNRYLEKRGRAKKNVPSPQVPLTSDTSPGISSYNSFTVYIRSISPRFRGCVQVYIKDVVGMSRQLSIQVTMCKILTTIVHFSTRFRD